MIKGLQAEFFTFTKHERCLSADGRLDLYCIDVQCCRPSLQTKLRSQDFKEQEKFKTGGGWFDGSNIPVGDEGLSPVCD